MGYTCEFWEQRSIVYCRSDAACLCLSCDRNVHSANALSQRHSRALVCERCNSQPAIFRCVEEKVSLCQNCDWMAHASSSSTGSSTHKREALSCYTGHPSAVELSTIWSFLLDDPSVGDSTCEQRMVKSSMPSLDNELHNVELPVESKNLTWSKVSNSGAKGSNIFDDGPFYENFNMDEVDLSIENYEEMFVVSLDNPNEGIDGLFWTKEMSVAESSCQGVNDVECIFQSYYTWSSMVKVLCYNYDNGKARGSAVGMINAMQPACRNAVSAESMMSCKTEPPTLCFARIQSSVSFSNLTGESSAAGDYQDSGASSMLLMGEPPWGPPCPESSYSIDKQDQCCIPLQGKEENVPVRFLFEKRVRYVSLKARADVRRRVKGRFVKAGDAYDYDPLSQTLLIGPTSSSKKGKRWMFTPNVNQIKNAAEKELGHL
ncbi:hypothetical protein RND71_013066 [Anisodus tanguticus]|uniref:B box-type domain-containing protein n=1 Tax=Anisodus tanguticus TaxID=243964 RepID=A0AAE1SGU8_9SOLA|nr:hypothetical protein RND71_013066 [Anisodus tanguticus]